MKKYKITAESVGYLEEIIEAENEDQAWKILEEELDAGVMPEVHGSIENKKVEEFEE